MHPPKPTNSASRLKAKKKHVMKDIEEWMVKDLTLDLNQGNTRMSGKNDDTVTEVRMLKARLIDLGVERYKFLSHFSHEKQKFLENRKRKEAGAKNLRSYSTMSEPIMSYGRPSTTSSRQSGNERSDVASVVSKKTEYRSPKEFVHNNTQQNLHRPLPPHRAKTVQFFPQALDNKQRSRDSRTVVSEPPRLGISRENTIASSVYSAANSVSSFKRDEDTSWSRRNKLSKYGGKCPSVTGDPRYAFLERALSSKYDKHIKTNVTDIVNSIESLHKPPKNAKEAKPKWEEKIQAFMKEVGISWFQD
ncbi:uncharacterized protein LOC133204411 [Saccostrea echinata]|uniref:uncharacterized protein LOC133204411 n=1 Tax=Saccostrea echinata TaxID=191078 RepID=UPI002A7EDC28|nr:uncharacterized protein LOC133204411 [Saccostrea echinata]